MPRIPHIGVAAALVLTGLPPNAGAQSWRTQVGYDALVAELGGAPPTQYSGSVFVAAADSSWSYRKGTSEASSPTDAWRFDSFVEDSTWLTGQTPIGYGDSDDNTELTDMQGMGGYTSVYLRRTFNVPTGSVPFEARLRVYVDDGAVVWINGVEVARLHVGGGFLAFDDTAGNHESEWEDVVIDNADSVFVEGTNVLAIHALNQNLNSSDFSIDAELTAPALRVTQVEGTSGSNYLPETWSGGGTPSAGDSFGGTANIAGKTIFVRSIDTELTYGQSSHARSVAVNYMYGNGTRTLAAGLEEVDAYSAGGWLNGDFLKSGTLTAPVVETNPLQNHSWIAEPNETTTAAELNEVVRRVDYAADRDGFLCVAGLNNESTTTVPPVLATGYNVISVGRTDGKHSRGGTLADYDGPGRTKPEIVAPGTATSWSTGMVSSAGTLLLASTRHESFPKAQRPDVLKAILMAGAIKSEFAGWTRTPSQPIDTVYGAGELNIQNSYRILLGGEATTATSAEGHAWHGGSLAGSGNAVFTFEVRKDIGEFSAVLTWNRQVDTATWLGDPSFSDTVADMDLELHRLVGGTPQLCDSSDSAVDNVEHVWLRGLPPGTYTLTVSTDVATDFALAWRADPSPAPSFTMAPGSSPDELVFDLSNLAVGKDYLLERSTDLDTWTTETTITATAATEAYTDTDGLAGKRQFYKLTWNPVN